MTSNRFVSRGHCCYQPKPALYEKYYLCQAGNGLSSFSGARIQRGHGLGNVFRGVAKIAAPLLLKGAKTLGKRILQTGSQVMQDVASGKSIKKSLKRRGLQNLKDMLTPPPIKTMHRTANKRKRPMRPGIKDNDLSTPSIRHKIKKRKTSTSARDIFS